MKQYMVSVWHVDGEEPPSNEEMQQIAKDVDAFNARIAAEGIEVVGAACTRPTRRRWSTPARAATS